MRPNYKTNAFLLVSIIFDTILKRQIQAERDSAPKKLTCEPGLTYFSRSVIPIGSCVGCPDHWSQCFREPTEEDRKNCEDGCRKPTPTPLVILTTVTPEVTKTTMVIPTTTTLMSSATNDQTPSAAGYSSDKRWVDIVIGVTVALGVVVVGIVCVLLFLQWRRQKNKKLNRPPIRCTVSNQDVSSLRGVQETGSRYSSVANLPTTYL